MFDAVQLELAARLNRANRKPHKSYSPLKGLLFDSNGIRMIPSHSKKSGLRYCYYQSWVLNQGQKEKAGIVSRVPAQEIEDAVKAAIMQRTSDADQRMLLECSGDAWASSIERIDVHQYHLTVALKPVSNSVDTMQDAKTTTAILFDVTWTKPPMRRRRELTIPDNNVLQQRPIRAETRSRLLKAIAQARLWLDRLINDRDTDIAAIAKENHLSVKTVRATLTLAFLAPDIVEAAIDGRLHRSLTVTQMTGLPANWEAQKQALGLV